MKYRSLIVCKHGGPEVLKAVERVKAGGKALIIGASGGIGAALLQLGQLAELGKS